MRFNELKKKADELEKEYGETNNSEAEDGNPPEIQYEVSPYIIGSLILGAIIGAFFCWLFLLFSGPFHLRNLGSIDKEDVIDYEYLALTKSYAEDIIKWCEEADKEREIEKQEEPEETNWSLHFQEGVELQQKVQNDINGLTDKICDALDEKDKVYEAKALKIEMTPVEEDIIWSSYTELQIDWDVCKYREKEKGWMEAVLPDNPSQYKSYPSEFRFIVQGKPKAAIRITVNKKTVELDLSKQFNELEIYYINKCLEEFAKWRMDRDEFKARFYYFMDYEFDNWLVKPYPENWLQKAIYSYQEHKNWQKLKEEK